MKRYFIFILLPVIVLAACKKDDEENNNNQNNDPEVIEKYYPLAVENYWVYTTEELDQNGYPTGQIGQDCVVVNTDSLMEGAVYYKVQTYTLNNGSYSLLPGWIFYRDSMGHLIDQDGLVHFAEERIDDTIASQIEMLPNGADTMFAVFVIMQDVNQSVTVPAGSYDVLDVEHHTYSDYFPQSLSQPVISSYLYAKGTGLIMFDTDYASGKKQRNKLKDFNLISD